MLFLTKCFCALAYTPGTYLEVMVIRPVVMYNPYATSSKEQTDDVIMFTQFEEGRILTETCKNAEIGDKSDNKSIMMSEQDMDTLNFDDDSDHDIISKEMLEDIHDGSQTHLNVNRGEARYKIRDRIRQRQSE